MIPNENLLSNLSQTGLSQTSLSHAPSLEADLQREQTIEELGLLELGNVPIFEEATQTAAHFLNTPICILGILDRNRIWFKSAVGLSRIGLMNSLATTRQMPRQGAFCTHVIEKQRVLAIIDASIEPDFASSQLVQHYGIRSYLGVPVFAANNHCIGALSVMGLAPRSFSEQEIAFLELIARWSMSEYERNWLQQQSQYPASLLPIELDLTATSSVKASLISEMTQELCTPLTSILGMAKVLSQGIYGSLSHKQQEYLQIIHNSGQYLASLINEIVDLGELDAQTTNLNLSPVDIEMLCQQAISSLSHIVQRREQKIHLTVEPGNRIWILDKDKVRQMLYHLVSSVIQASTPDNVIRIHVSRKQKALHISVWCSHPWLGEGLPQVLSANQTLPDWASINLNSHADQVANRTVSQPLEADRAASDDWQRDDWQQIEAPDLPETAQPGDSKAHSRQNLGLLLSHHLATLHTGDITIQGSLEEGYRYVIRLPQMKAGEEIIQRPLG